MKYPVKLENDFREYSKAEKVILAVVLALVVLVVISWAAAGFALSETTSTERGDNLSHTFGYGPSGTPNVNHSDKHSKI